MIVISNSQITSKLTCNRLHDYTYIQNLMPRVNNLDLRRGTVGHALLEAFFRAIMAGSSVEEAEQAGIVKLREIIVNSDPLDILHAKMLVAMDKVFRRFVRQYHKSSKFKILSVESLITVPMTKDIMFGMYTDLLVEYTMGTYKGKVGSYDHKIVSHFKTLEDLKFDPQQIKYQKALQLQGHDTAPPVLNQILHSAVGTAYDDDFIRESPIILTQQGVDTIWDESVEVAEQIYVERVTGNRNTTRAMNYAACNRCPMRELCVAELNGSDTTQMRKIDYVKRVSPLKDWEVSQA